MSQQVKSLQYPEGISSIPFASYLHIERYEYQHALDEVARQQSDALGLLKQTENGLLGNVISGVNTAIKVAAEKEAKLDENIVANPFQAYGNFSKGNNDKMFEFTDGVLKAHTQHIATVVPGENSNRTVEQLAADKEFRKK